MMKTVICSQRKQEIFLAQVLEEDIFLSLLLDLKSIGNPLSICLDQIFPFSAIGHFFICLLCIIYIALYMVGISCNPDLKHCRKSTATKISVSLSHKKVKACQFTDKDISFKV